MTYPSPLNAQCSPSARFAVARFAIVLYGVWVLAAYLHAKDTPRFVPAKRVNILLITSEDNGPELGCYGDRFARTPKLDRLAHQGIRFDRAFVTTASCSESRSTMLTGLYPHQNGQIGLASHHYRTFDGTPNIASLLKTVGYRTGLIGKLHVNPPETFPFDYRPSVNGYNSFDQRDVRRVAKAAAEFFQSGEAPFFLMVNYSDAHLPFIRQQHGLPVTPQEPDDVKPLPWIGLDTPELRKAQADYYNCMSRLDTGVGLLLAEVAKAGLESSTLVIYLGDHGAQFPRGKLASFESSLRVPLIVRWPGVIDPGQVRPELVSTIDLLPTVLQAIDKKVTRPSAAVALPGKSLLDFAKAADKPAWREYLHAEYHGHYPPLYFPQRSVRDGRYKLIVNLLQDRPNPVAKTCTSRGQVSYVSTTDVAGGTEDVRKAYATWSKPPPVELYDLRSDPHERHNLADDPAVAQVRTRLLARLRAWQEETGDPLRDPTKLARLTAEHDAMEKPYNRPKVAPWKYPEYLAP